MSIDPYKEERPWGRFERFTENEPSTVKILTINAGEELSLQTHKGREEFWHILSGSGTITVGEEKKEAEEGDEFFVEKEQNHRISARTDMKILEIALGDFDEDDIVRVEDKYNRDD